MELQETSIAAVHRAGFTGMPAAQAYRLQQIRKENTPIGALLDDRRTTAVERVEAPNVKVRLLPVPYALVLCMA